MENAQLISLSRQAALRRQLDVIANNLANMNTTGFKSTGVLFREYLMPVAQASAFSGEDQTLSYVVDGRAVSDFTPGGIQMTGNPLDVAIDGDAWFTVNTAAGERYTRNGSFTLGPDGALVTNDGNPVMGETGPITVPAGQTDLQIAADGTVTTAQGPRGRLRLVRFEDPDTLVRDGASLFVGPDPLPARGQRVVQGALEESNVRAIVEMSRMIEVTRAYTSLARNMSDSDELHTSAINQLGQVES